MAVLSGMQHDTSLNGQVVKVLGVDDKSGRLVVKLRDGSEKRVTQDHLEALPHRGSAAHGAEDEEATLVGMTKDATLNGDQVQVLRVDKDTGRYVVRLADGTERRVRGEHLKVSDDTPFQSTTIQSRARLVGFAAHQSLNGQVVNVLGIDTKSGRYIVRLHDGSKEKVLPTNLESLVVKQEPVEATLGNQSVEVLGFDKDSAAYVIAGDNGTVKQAALEELGGLTNATARGLAAMAIAGAELPPLPKLTVCNAYPSHRPLSVLVKSGQQEDLLLAASLRYPSCVDAEFPVQLGSLVFLLDGDAKNHSLQVGEYPFLQRTVGEREVLVVHRNDKDSLQAAVTKTTVPAELPEHEAGRLIAFDGYAGGLHKTVLTAAKDGQEHDLARNQLYSVPPGRYDLSLACPGGRTSPASLDVRGAQTFVVVLTGAQAGLEGEPTPPGLLLHGVEAFTTAQTAEKCEDHTPIPAKVTALLQLSSALAAAAVWAAAL